MAQFSPTLTSRAAGRSALGFGMGVSFTPQSRLFILAETSPHSSSVPRTSHQFSLLTQRRSNLANLRLPSAIPWVLWEHSQPGWFTRLAQFVDWARNFGCKQMFG